RAPHIEVFTPDDLLKSGPSSDGFVIKPYKGYGQRSAYKDKSLEGFRIDHGTHSPYNGIYPGDDKGKYSSRPEIYSQQRLEYDPSCINRYGNLGKYVPYQGEYG